MARILLADDDTAGCELAARALEADGHTVVRAQDGQEALDQLARATFDLLISDVQMPVLDGIAVAERAMASSPAIKILLVSGFTDGIERAAAMRGPRLRTVTKPFTLDGLKSEVRSLLQA